MDAKKHYQRLYEGAAGTFSFQARTARELSLQERDKIQKEDAVLVSLRVTSTKRDPLEWFLVQEH